MRDKPPTGALEPMKPKSMDFDSTKNVFIEGENLEVSKLLRKAYEGQVRLIYLDPPYNTGDDYVYADNFADPLGYYLRETGQISDGKLMTTAPEKSGRLHSKWLSMMYPRLFLAWSLLSPEGVIFVSIDDHEIHNLRIIMNDVFGEENFVGVIIWQTATDNNATQVATEHEYIVCYAKDLTQQSAWERPSSKGELIQKKYLELKKEYGKDIQRIETELTRWIRNNVKTGEVDLGGVAHYCFVDEKGVYYPGNSANTRPGGYNYDITHPITGKVCAKPANGYRWPKKTFDQAAEKEDVEWGPDHTYVPKIKKRLETATELLKSVYYEDNRRATKELTDLLGGKAFDNPKSPRLIRRFIEFAGDKEGIVMDLFAGSCATAEAVIDLNRDDGGKRRFVMVQLPELTPDDSVARKMGYKTISQIGMERIRRALKARKVGAKPNEDLGFKAFRLTESKIFVWDPDKATDERTLKKQLTDAISKVGEADHEALAFELMLRQGFRLDSALEQVEVKKNSFFKASDERSKLWLCFDDRIQDESVSALNLTETDKLIAFDTSLTDTQKVNLSRKQRVITV
jgi:adenine-specific DNA-methyltransferase